MDFVSSAFLLFLPVALLLLRSAGTSRQAEILLVAASLGFYAYHQAHQVVLFALVVGAGWIIAAGPTFGRRESSRQSAWKWAVVLLLLPLAVFKYGPWLSGLAGISWAGLGLPLGISFYTFQVVAFVVSVGRAEQGVGSVGKYAAVMTAFPQVVAGPIVRMSTVSASLSRHLWWRRSGWREGAALFLSGAVKKAALADGIGRLVDPIFANHDMHSSAMLWLAVLGYGLQIYWDFSGYSDMAIGVGRWIGWRLPENFDGPYRTASLQEFWRKWHQTLSAYLRDYVYIPLGGSRHGPVRALLALFLTMLLGGLWHGASWCFVLWGAGHGLALALERYVVSRWAAPGAGSWPVRWLGRFWTLGVVLLLWVPFRLGNTGGDAVATTFRYWARMFAFEPGSVDSGVAGAVAAGWVAVLLLATPVRVARWTDGLRRMSPVAFGGLVGAVGLFAVLAASAHGKQFIYFVF